MSEDWDNKFSYLRSTRSAYHNDDYFAFLVEKVWKLAEKTHLIDIGCGYGFLGLKLLPLLHEGSRYTGVDHSAGLLKKARDIFADLPYSADFIQADVFRIPASDSSFDTAVCHALMAHLASPERAVREMKRVTRDGGLIITCESNWNAMNALLHIDEFDKMDTTDLGFLQKFHERNRQATGKDGNIGVKMPVLLHRAGLKNVNARVSDSAQCLLPPIDSKAKESLYQSLCADGLGRKIDDEIAEEKKQQFVHRGFSAQEAEQQIQRERRLTRKFITQGKLYHTVAPAVMMFSFGTVEKRRGA